MTSLKSLSRVIAQLFTVAAISFIGADAMASEATQFDVPPSVKTREQVKAELAQAQAEGTLMSTSEATVFVDRPTVQTRSRQDVQAEARAEARSHRLASLYAGS